MRHRSGSGWESRSRRPSRTRALLGALAAVAFAFAFGGIVTGSAQATEGSCPNEAIRSAQGSTYLPQCRAYELVTPPGATPEANGETSEPGTRAAQAGGALSWRSFYPIPEAKTNGMFFISRRTAGGWSTEDLIPPRSTEVSGYGCDPSVYLGPELRREVLEVGYESLGPDGSSTEACGRPEPPLISGGQAAAMAAAGLQVEPEGAGDLYLHQLGLSLYQPLNLTPVGVAPANAFFQDASSSWSHVVFDEDAKLTPGAPEGEAVYEWVEGAVHLVSVLPDGKPAPGTLVDRPQTPHEENEALFHLLRGTGVFRGALSTDGTRAFFNSGSDLDVRVNPEAGEEVAGAKSASECGNKACTLQLDASKAGGAGGGGVFLAATEDGSTAFFMDSSEAKLTSNTQPGSGENLYSYELQSGTLTDLTPQAKVDLLGILGFGQQGGAYRLYFDAQGALSGADREGRSPQSGLPNLYVLEAGRPIAFIATLQPEPFEKDLVVSAWQRGREEEDEASPTGAYLAFGSLSSPTGYDNADAVSGGLDNELFLYDAEGESLACLSCDPSGARPVAPTKIEPFVLNEGQSRLPAHLRRNLLDDGTVFFTTREPLSPAAVNGRPDLYEYTGGKLHLLSGGVEAAGAYFLEASGRNPATGGEGEEAFFITAQRLLGAAGPSAGPVIYDARVDGGFAEPAPTPECEPQACRVAALPSAFSAPTSATFLGPANLPPPKKAAHAKKPAKRSASERRLARALERCARRHRHNARARRLCRARARRRIERKAKASARRRRRSSRQRSAPLAARVRRASRHSKGGAR